MKKVFIGMMIGVFLLLQACSSEEATTEQTPVEQAEQAATEQKEKPIEVDKGLLNVEITLPSSMFKDENIDETIAKAKENGVQEVTKNEDGSLTYKISKSEYNKMMQEAKDSMVKTIDGLKNSQDFKSIKNVDHNDSFSEFTLTVDKEAYQGSFDGFAALGIGLASMYYQAFDGVSPENNKTKINLKDENTGDMFDSVIYPDALNNIKN